MWTRLLWARCVGARFVMAGAILAMTGCADAPTSPDPVISDAAIDGSIVLKTPEQSPGPPYWAISGNGGFIPHTDQWAAIPFLRELDCVPGSANLLVLVVPDPFFCTLTVEGHEHWENGPGIDPAPRQTLFRGLGAVPIVFVEWTEVASATAGGLTLPELLGLPSAMIGHASFYKETDILGISGPHGPGKGMYKINARGELGDGRSFKLHVNEVLGELRVVQIRFGH